MNAFISRNVELLNRQCLDKHPDTPLFDFSALMHIILEKSSDFITFILSMKSVRSGHQIATQPSALQFIFSKTQPALVPSAASGISHSY